MRSLMIVNVIMVILVACKASALATSASHNTVAINETGHANDAEQTENASEKNDENSEMKYCASSGEVSTVMRNIMKNSKYNVHKIPSFGKPLAVKLAITVLVFRDMSEVDMTYTVDFFLRTKWRDERLRNSLDCKLTMTLGKKHPAEIIWVPDTMIENAVTSYLHEVLTNNHKIDISPNGDVFWSTRVTVKAMCPMDLLKYPRDKQTCFIDLLSYAYTTDLITYMWSENNSVGIMDTTLSQFDVTNFYKKSYKLTYAAGEYSILKAVFVFERRIGYYLIQVYIPCIFLVVLAGLSFWVDARATPARVALSLTTLLTIATIWSSTNSNMPPVSYVKAVDVYFLTSFGFVLVTLLEYIIVLNYNVLKTAIQRKLNMFDKKTAEDREKESFCKKHGQLISRRSSSKNSIEMTESQIARYSNGNYKSRHASSSNCTLNTESKVENKEEDVKIVSNIDKVTKFAYPLAYILFNVFYWYKLKDN